MEFAYVKLAESLLARVQEEEWRPGERIPPIRQLAFDYRVSRNTVQHALHLLEAKGTLEARDRSGYFVTMPAQVPVPQLTTNSQTQPSWVSVPDLFHAIMTRSAAFDICPEQPLGSTPDSLKLLNRQIGRAMRDAPQYKASYYNAPEGNESLRTQLSQHYRTVGLRVSREEICITAGCQNGLMLTLMACCQPGDIVAVESPAFYGVLQALQHLNLKVIEVPASATEGILVDELARYLHLWNVRACVVTPGFATPTGACMKPAAKKRLVDLCAQQDVTLIEDDIYGDLGFHFRPEPLKHYDQQDNVVLCSSLSKSLSRDLRIGWVMGGKWHDKIVRTKLVTQLAGPQAVQQGLAGFLAEGHFKRHLSRYRQRLKHQRDQLLDLLRQHWRCEFHYVVPEGGLTLWLTLAPSVDTTSLYNQLIGEGIVITPGALFTTQGDFSHHLRLSFAHPFDDARRAAVIKLGEAIAALGG